MGPTDYIKIPNLIHRRLYRLQDCHQFDIGVFDATRNHFVGLKVEWGYSDLITAGHWDLPHLPGLHIYAKPVKDLGVDVPEGVSLWDANEVEQSNPNLLAWLDEQQKIFTRGVSK